MVSIDEIKEAVDDAEIQIRRANTCLGKIVNLLAGKLRISSEYDKSFYHAKRLADLKRELKKFDMHTMQWKD